MQQIKIGGDGELHPGQMGGGAITGGAIGNRLRPRPRRRQHLGAILELRALFGAHDHDIGHIAQQHHRGEIPLHIKGQVFIKRGIDGVRAGGAEIEGVAIGPRLGHEIRPDIAPCPGATIHHNGLAKRAGKRFRQAPRINIRASAIGESAHQRDWAAWPGISLRQGWRGDQAGEKRGKQTKAHGLKLPGIVDPPS